MDGRRTYTRSEIDRVRLVIGSQLEAYRELTRAVRAADVGDVQPSLAEFEHLLFNTLALALDRPFVHRVRTGTGAGPSPLDELEVICDSLLRDGVLRPGLPGYSPGSSITGLPEGEHIRLSAEQFERLAEAVFAELEERFAEEGPAGPPSS